MRGSSSPESAPWWEIPLDWPVEHVACRLEVVEPRRLTALEWAVLRVLEAFGDAPPSLEEMAEELGLGEPRFLADVLRALVSQEALVARPGVGDATEPADVLFTQRGRELFRKGQVDGVPMTPGHPVCFDALTDEDLPADDVKGAAHPGCPVIDPSRFTEPRQEVGLERLRAIVQRWGPPVGGADAHIRSVRVLAREEAGRLLSGFRWVTRSLSLVPAPEGRFHLHAPALSARQRSWLTERRLGQWVVPAQAVTHAWAPHPPFRRGGQRLEAWLSASVEQLIPVARAAQEAKRLVDGARREVLLHAAWAAAPGLVDALTSAAKRGVAVYVLGAAAHQLRDWSTAPQRAPGFVVEVVHADVAPGALVVDGREALLLDEVTAEVEELGTYAFEAAGATRAQAAALGGVLREALLQALPSLEAGPPPAFEVGPAHVGETTVSRLLAEPRLHQALARLALRPAVAEWQGLESWLAARCQGAERVIAVQQVALLTGQLIPDATPAPWRDAGASAWRAFREAVLSAGPAAAPDPVLRALFKLAPQGTAPGAVLQPLVERWVQPVPALRSTAALELLGRLRALVEKEAALRCPGFLAALELCLEVVPPPPATQGLEGLAKLVASVAPAERARRWAWEVAALWPAPNQLQDFAGWRRRHEPLHPLLGPELNAHQSEQWKRLVSAAPALTAEQLTEQLRLSHGVLAPPEAVASLLARPSSEDLRSQVERLVLVRDVSRRVFTQGALTDEAWSRHLQARLTVPAQSDSLEAHGPLLDELSQRLRSWPGADTVLRTWARALVGTLPPSVVPEGLDWWLQSLRPVAGALGSELEGLAGAALSRHVGALRDARQRNAPLWGQLTETWQALGLSRSSLEERVQPPAASASPSKKQGKKEKKR